MTSYSATDNRLLALTRILSEPVAVFSLDGVIVAVNPALCHVVGYTVAELIGQHFTLLSAEPESSQRTLDRHCNEVLLRLIRHKNGSIFSVELSLDYPASPEDALAFLSLRCLDHKDAAIDELRWRAAIESSGDGVWDWDLRTGEKYHSESWCQMLGFDRVTVAQDKDFWFTHVHPEDRALALAALADCLAGRAETYAAEFRMLTKAGDYHWISAHGRVVEWDKDKPVRVLGTHRDIQLLREMESAYVETRASFSAWLEQSPDAIAITHCGPDNLYVYVNAAYCTMVGYTREELLGTAITDSRFWVNELQAGAVFELLANGIPIIDLPCQLKSREGRELATSLSGQRIVVDGKPRLLVARRDVSERVFAEHRLRDSEERWRFAIEGNGDALWDWNVETGTVYRSPRWLDWLQLPAETATVSVEEHGRVLLAEDRSKLNAGMRKLLLGEIDELLDECRALRADGETIWLSYRCRVMERRPGSSRQRGQRQIKTALNERRKLDRATRVIGMVRDITQQRERQQALDLQMDRISHSGRLLALGEMATTIAHEINQPLAVISSYAGVIARKTADNHELRELASRVEEQALRAGQIIWRMRQFARNQDAELAPIEMAELINESLAWVKMDTWASGVEFEIRIPSGIPPILGDRIQIQQVLLNLLRNAIQSMRDSATKKIVVVRGRVDTARHEVVIDVADRGCGLPSQVAFDVFKPFFTTKSEGLGLGLSISQSIIARHHGRLWSSARAGGGTVFSFSIPQAVAATVTNPTELLPEKTP